ncbi:MAG: protein-(glutamine-N5) methyltransferase, release factor-specific [Rickettsiales bacterium]|nr:protein-(glutamine-N5) methyltransferase, release factor-specific [Rickettsiales bacterium]|tara:strand:- start:40293 stop:41087 length:795 start_codon:yes stop_codon:yes gene_type:complete
MATKTPIPRHIQRAILGHILGCQPEELIGAIPSLSSQQQVMFEEMKGLFSSGVPLSRIIGFREFWSLKFFLNQSTLDPRPDSETLVQSALEHIPNNKQSSLLDLGTGSGCLALSILHERADLSGTLVDNNLEALEQAKYNARYHNLNDRCTFIHSSWLENVSGHFNYIVSNPPYISHKAYEKLADNVKNHDPQGALIAKKNGLDCYETILKQLAVKKVTFNLAFFEIGFDQEKSVSELISNAGFEVCKTVRDLAGHPRVIIFKP